MALIRKPTIKQRLAFKNLLEVLRNGDPFSLKSIMESAGYSPKTAICPDKNLTSKIGWKQLIAKIDDEEVLNKFQEILRDSDKRASMDAGKELLKLKDRYPDKKIKLSAYDERDEVVE